MKSYNKLYINFLGLKVGSFKRSYHKKAIFFIDLGSFNLVEL